MSPIQRSSACVRAESRCSSIGYGLVGDHAGVIPLRPDRLREQASRIPSRFQSTNDDAEIVASLPAEFVAGLIVDGDARIARKHFSTASRVRGFVGRDPPQDHARHIDPKLERINRA
jgi:hypothetical protein